MKKFMAAALAALMVVQTSMMALAADYGTLETNLTLEVKSEKGSYGAGAEVEAGDKVDFKAAVDMSNVEEQFKKAIADAEAFVDGYYADNAKMAANVKADMRDTKFEYGEFELSLTYPTGLVLPEKIAKGTAMSGFDSNAKLAFEEVKRVVRVNGIESALIITVKVKDDVTVGQIENSLKTDASYLSDMTFVGYDVEVTKAGLYAISGEINGHIKADFNFDGIGEVERDIVFENTKPVTVNVKAAVRTSSVSGTADGAADGATVKLVKGSTEIASTTVKDGAFSFDEEVEDGIYNVVVTSGEKTVTTVIEVKGDTVVAVTVPTENVNTQVGTADGVESDAVVNVDGVADQKKEENNEVISEGGSIDIKTIITEIIEKVVKAIEDAVNENKDPKDKREVEGLNGIKTTSTVTDSKGNSTTEEVGEVGGGKYVHLVVPFQTSGRKGFSIIRSVAGEGEKVKLEELKQVDSAKEAAPGTFYVDEETDTIHIYSADAMADFAVAYENIQDSEVSETIPDADDKDDDKKDNTPTRRPNTSSGGTGTTISGGTSDSALIMPFTDVKVSDWYYNSVEYVYDNGIFKGATDTTFEPDTAITRGMIVTVLGRSSGIADEYAETGFADVAADEYYAAHIKWAAENGIVQGYGDGNFGPDDAVTREQMATIIYRYMVYLGRGPVGAWAVQLPYADTAEISEYAVEPVMFCYINSIMTGKDNNVFDPQGSATRAEVATIMMRCEF